MMQTLTIWLVNMFHSFQCLSLSSSFFLTLSYTSVSIALTTFIGILAYHIFQHVRHIKLWKKMPKLNLEFNRLNIVEVVNEPVDSFAAEEDFS